MRGNRGQTRLKCKPANSMKMHDYDRLPAELRQWVARAALPWRAKSVQKAYDRAMAKTGSSQRALAELDHLQQRLVARDAAAIWGADHPAAQPGITRPAGERPTRGHQAL